jgi:deazaflavin-dependent oxidoreductase (nitroreductase family)
MPTKISDPQPYGRLRRFLFRSPIWLYKIGLGGILGGRFLLLNHIGRKSGRQRQTVLEVVKHEPQTATYYIASGFGKKSDWYLNLLQNPEVTIQVGRKVTPAAAQILTPDASGRAMVDYARRNPRAAKQLMRFCGYAVDGTEQEYFIMGHDHIPFVKLSPRTDVSDQFES